MRTADVAIVGGGVIGCAIAHALTHGGVTNVVVLERGALAGGATGVCPGGIRQQFEGEADCRLAQRSVRFYERINDILEPEAPFHFERSGYLFLADTEAHLDRYRRNVALQNRLGIPSQVLTPQAIASRVPALVLDGVVGGAFCAEDGFLEDCHGVTHTLAARARARGARVLHERVDTIEPIAGAESDGRPRAWRLESSGGHLEVGQLVLAAGAESIALAAPHGIHLPITPERRRLAFTLPYAPTMLSPLVVAAERAFAGKQLDNGVFYLGWLGETPTTDDLTFAERALASGASLLPALADVPVRRILAGWYDTTPDHRPILGPVAPGLHVAAGFSGHGFMIAPAVGDVIAAAVTGQRCGLPVEAFSLDRFERATPEEGLVI